jgi:hypothetical protein
MARCALHVERVNVEEVAKQRVHHEPLLAGAALHSDA